MLELIIDFYLNKDTFLSEPIDFNELKSKMMPFYNEVHAFPKSKFTVEQINHFDKGMFSFWNACDHAKWLTDNPSTNQKERLIVQNIINDYLLEARKNFNLFKNPMDNTLIN